MDPAPHPLRVNEVGPVGGFLALQGLLHGPYGGTPRGRGQDEVRRSGLTDRSREHLTRIVRAVGSLDSEDHETVTGYRLSPPSVHHWHELTGEGIVERMLRGESTATRNNGDRRWLELSIEDDPEPAHGYPEDHLPMDGNSPLWKVGKKEE